MVVAVDARRGRHQTGIGIYAEQLVIGLAGLEGYEPLPIAHRRHRGEWRRRGLRSWSPRRRGGRGAFPPADVIHGPNYHAPPHPSAARVATIHDLGFVRLPDCHPPGMTARLDTLIRDEVARGTHFACDSEITRQDALEHYGLSEDRCRVAHLGLSAGLLEITPEAWRRGPREPFVLSVGEMVPRKDLPTVVEAFAQLRAEHPDLHLVLVGNKAKRWLSDWPVIERQLAGAPELARRVHVYDQLPLPRLAWLYRSAAAYVSATRWEGFGLTILEALAFGLHVAVPRVGAVPEVAAELPFYCEPQDPASLAAALHAALAARGGAADRRAAGQRHARRFSWSQTAERTAEVYAIAHGERR